MPLLPSPTHQGWPRATEGGVGGEVRSGLRWGSGGLALAPSRGDSRLPLWVPTRATRSMDLQGCSLLHLVPQLLALVTQPSSPWSRTLRMGLGELSTPGKRSSALSGFPPPQLGPSGQPEPPSPDPWEQSSPSPVAMGGQLLGLGGRGINAKLEEPGAQQVEPVPGTSAPPQGERTWQRLPACGTQSVPAWLPRLPTFPRCRAPSFPSPQVNTWVMPRALVQGSKGCHYAVTLGCPGS